MSSYPTNRDSAELQQYRLRTSLLSEA